ncbi:protease modulator HflC [Mameliella sediminis]|uniref:protease modulator HflC n=1 Tax=Mameliella sediminis TaxID=2836866 RepID=UPI001C46AC7C|nr:protease modulator HflC [Mameliella sediminis]MBY6116263.1 protease modulator HflC [Antarctobacter heliothermus]MBY6146228.1 protease modulator HflC [Mameliella alba]MBV7397016.1 protease modulator HflC [Mameliella sediminis]MBY6161885.1 protease modulator HflC [Mameliella alba]MBY6170355.1 protease modulator HflC [Mameliella alba]
MRKTTYLLPVLVIAIVVFLSSIFVVDEREKALVLQFGQIKAVKEEPGLAFKIPLIQEVVKYDDRILSLDTQTIEVTPSDDRRLVVDAFARYRIANVVQFRQAVGIGGIRVAEDRLSGILNAQIREVLGADLVTSDRILSEDRRELMVRIRDAAREEARSLGLDVVDVRLKQTNLPAQNLDATFDRMRAEREREAADERARGNEAAQRVRALADRTVVETLSEADRDANVIRGEADAERNRIFADAYGADPEFFAFYRSLQAYDAALRGENSTMVMTPDSQFFNYFKNELADGGTLTLPAPTASAKAPDAPAPETAEDPAPEGPAPTTPAPAPADPAPAPAAPEADTAPADN